MVLAALSSTIYMMSLIKALLHKLQNFAFEEPVLTWNNNRTQGWLDKNMKVKQESAVFLF